MGFPDFPASLGVIRFSLSPKLFLSSHHIRVIRLKFALPHVLAITENNRRFLPRL